jgi:hypothetical protein
MPEFTAKATVMSWLSQIGASGRDAWRRDEFEHGSSLGPFFENPGQREVPATSCPEGRPYLKGTSGTGFVPGPPIIFDGVDAIGGPDANPDGFGQFSSWRGGDTGNATVGEANV